MPLVDLEKRKAYHKKWCEEHPDKVKSYYRKYEKKRPDNAWISSRKLKYHYGITLDDYIRMEEEQDGKCFICGGLNDDGKRLYVDHNHETKQVRALLCRRCNSVIGYANENIETLKSAIGYLEKFNGK